MVKFIVSSLLIFCVCYGTNVYAQHDPTAPLSWQVKPKATVKHGYKLPQLQSVICQQQQKCSAILNGILVSTGGNVKGYTVSRINDDSVVVTRNGKQWRLALFANNIKQ